MSELRDIDLMLLADGELEGDEAQKVADVIEADSDARTKTEALGQIRETVRTYLELETDAAGDADRFAGMWDTIERRIQTNGKKTAPVETTGRKKPGIETEATPGFMQQLREWFGGWRGHIATGLAAAGAVAVIVAVVRPFERVVEHRVEVVNTDKAQPEMAVQHLTSQPPEVEDLEVYDGSGMILTIPGDSDDESSTAVIWISKDDAVEEDPI